MKAIKMSKTKGQRAQERDFKRIKRRIKKDPNVILTYDELAVIITQILDKVYYTDEKLKKFR